MKAKAWRQETRFLVTQIENLLNFKPDMPTITENMSVADYRYQCELRRRCTAEAQLDAIKRNVEWFKKAYLNPETADDFDEQ